MAEVKVYFPGWPPDKPRLTHVATVDVPLGEDMPLEYAWRWTNNVEGSWSVKERELEGQPNGDFNRWVTVTCPLYVDEKGKTWGHRSSMVGDLYLHDGVLHEVAVTGFRRVG